MREIVEFSLYEISLVINPIHPDWVVESVE
jgi:hypothetical protein